MAFIDPDNAQPGSFVDPDDDMPVHPVYKKLGKALGSHEDFWQGTKAAGAAVADTLGGIGKIPVQVAATAMAKLVNPSYNLDELWAASQETMEQKVPSFGSNLGKEAQDIYQKEMLPFAKLGELQEWVGDKAGELTGSKEVAGAVKMGSNFIPIPLVKHVKKVINTAKERFTRPDKQEPVKKDYDAALNEEFVDPDKPLSPIENTQQLELFDQPEQGRVANPYEASIGEWRVDENGIPIRADLSMDAQHVQEPLQRHLWGDELEPRVNPIGQAATLAEGIRQLEDPSIQGGIPLTQAIDDMPWAQRRGAINRELKGAVEATPEMDAALLESRSPFTGLGREQGGAIDTRFIEAAAKKGKEALDQLRKVAWDKFWASGGDYNGPEYADVKAINERIWALEKQERVAAGQAKQTLGEVAPGYTVIPEGTRVMAKHGLQYQEPTIGTVVGHKDIRFEDGPYRVPLVDFGDGMPRAIIPGHVTEVFSGPKNPFKGPGRNEAGAINMDVFTPDFQKIKKLANGVTLIMQGHSTGPRIYAVDTNKNIVGEVKFSHDTWARGPLASDNLEAQWATTDPKKTSAHGVDADRLAPTTKSEYPGLSAEMYKFASEQGNDIVASSAQTPEGQRMWESFEKRGVSQGKVIRSPGNRQQGALRLGSPTPKKDSVVEARSPETIAKKEELAKKAAALRVQGTQYDRVNTLEEALAGVDKSTDMSKMGANTLRSGSEGALRTNIKNKPLNFVRTVLQEARNAAEVKSKEYITNRQTGIIRLLKDLSQTEREDLAGMLLALDRNQKRLSPETMDKLGMTEAQRKVAQRIEEALEARYVSANEALMKQGYEPFAQRQGYFPSMFSGAYTSLIGFTDAKGKWHTKGIAQADTKWGMNQAINKYKEMGAEYAETMPLQRRGLNSYVGNNKTYNGFTDLVANLAKLDPEFAKAKSIADQHMADQIANLYRFDVHEMKKSGIKGSLGDRPWLSRKENTQQMFEALVDYLETGFRFDSLQGPLNDIGKMLTDPRMQKDMPNTAKFIQQHVDKITGQNLNPVGAAVNWAIDQGFAAVGAGPRAPKAAIEAATAVSTTLMMGMFNLGFATLQLSQLPIAMMTEGPTAGRVLGLKPHQLGHSAVTAGLMYPSQMMLAMSTRNPALVKNVPLHMKQAFAWAHVRGMFDYSEAELIKNLHKSKALVVAESVANASISIPEKMTRPPMFMFMADLMYKAGFRGEDALLRAQAATDYAMVNYFADERPGIYQALGEAGKALGALSTYKHNLIEQNISRAGNASPVTFFNEGKLTRPKYKKPTQVGGFVASLAMLYVVYGLSGLPGMEEASKISEALTDKSIREWVLDDPEKPNTALDGLASVYSGVDIQSRVAMSSLLPDSPLQATPHISNSWNILSSAYDAATKQDEASLRQLLYKGMPASMRNVYEAEALTDDKGWVYDTKGQKKTERPRTESETDVRKWLGLRPLDERIDQETLWTKRKRTFEVDKKLRELSGDFQIAVRLGSPVDTILKEYVALGGDPQELLNQIEAIKVNQNKTPKQHAEGEPGDSLGSLRRYKGYQ